MLWREENRRSRRKTLGAKDENQQRMTPGAGFEPGPQWWEVSALKSCYISAYRLDLLITSGTSVNDDGNSAATSGTHVRMHLGNGLPTHQQVGLWWMCCHKIRFSAIKVWQAWQNSGAECRIITVRKSILALNWRMMARPKARNVSKQHMQHCCI